jgi:hypothetical protein
MTSLEASGTFGTLDFLVRRENRGDTGKVLCMRDMTMFIRSDTNAYNRDPNPSRRTAARPHNEMKENDAAPTHAATGMTTTPHTTTGSTSSSLRISEAHAGQLTLAESPDVARLVEPPTTSLCATETGHTQRRIRLQWELVVVQDLQQSQLWLLLPQIVNPVAHPLPARLTSSPG